MPTPTLEQLQRAIQISEQIEKLQAELAALFRGQDSSVGRTPPAALKRKGKRVMSPEGRERIASAQRARWAKVEGGKLTAAKPAKAQRVVSPETRAKMAAAAKKRWKAKG